MFDTDLDILQTDFLHHHPHPVEGLDDTRLVDDAWLDDVIELEDNQTIRQVAVDMVNERRHSHTVHPVTIHYKNMCTSLLLNQFTEQCRKVNKMHS